MAPFSVVLGGSRSLSGSALPLVSRVVGALAAAGASAWSVGCSSGGDALALSALRSAGLCSAVSVFAVGGRGAGGLLVGFWSGSALGVVSAALAAGARPVWWAGGPAAVPLRVRLARRSAACVRAACGRVGPCSPRSSVAVWFLSSPSSVGSLGAARLAASLGVPVFVFCVGFAPSALAPLCPGGSWVAVASGPLAGALRWVAG